MDGRFGRREPSAEPLIPPDVITQVRDRTDIVAVVQEGVPSLKRRGRARGGPTSTDKLALPLTQRIYAAPPAPAAAFFAFAFALRPAFRVFAPRLACAARASKKAAMCG